MYPAVSDIMDQARSNLTDQRGFYNNNKLRPYLGQAVRKLSGKFASWSSAIVCKAEPVIIPAYQTAINMRSRSIRLSHPTDILVGAVDGQRFISDLTIDTDSVTLTLASAHGYSHGQQVVVGETVGLTGLNGTWNAVPGSSSTELVLQGAQPTIPSTSAGYTTSTGWVAKNNGLTALTPSGRSPVYAASRRFVDLNLPFLDFSTPFAGGAGTWYWDGEYIRFHNQASQPLLVYIIYAASSDANLDDADVITIPDSLDFLAQYTAGKAAEFRNPGIAAALLDSAAASLMDMSIRESHRQQAFLTEETQIPDYPTLRRDFVS